MCEIIKRTNAKTRHALSSLILIAQRDQNEMCISGVSVGFIAVIRLLMRFITLRDLLLMVVQQLLSEVDKYDVFIVAAGLSSDHMSLREHVNCVIN